MYEEYYWSLLGATGKRREFQLLRSLVDSGNASWIDGRLTINIRIGKMESLSGDKEGSYSLHLTANYRLIVAPNTENRSAEGLRKCDTIIIRGVMDYHGKGANNNWIIP